MENKDINIYIYLEYRKYLKDFYTFKKLCNNYMIEPQTILKKLINLMNTLSNEDFIKFVHLLSNTNDFNKLNFISDYETENRL